MFRVMFHTAFIRSNVLMLTRDDVDLLWDVKDQFPKEFRTEVRYCFHYVIKFICPKLQELKTFSICIRCSFLMQSLFHLLSPRKQ